jgi:hypothetical protein
LSVSALIRTTAVTMGASAVRVVTVRYGRF